MWKDEGKERNKEEQLRDERQNPREYVNKELEWIMNTHTHTSHWLSAYTHTKHTHLETLYLANATNKRGTE